MKRLLKEPLGHFLLIGALLFAAYSWRNHGADQSRTVPQVRVSEDDVKWLRETFARQWQREPTREECRGLVTAFLKEELLAREARAMGLDENDSVIRRVLAQKVEFLVQNTSRLAEPAESDLRAFYAAHREQFQSESRIAFTQIFFSREKRNDAAADAKAALEDLRRSSNAVPRSGLGDASLIEADLRDLDPQAVASQFGREFAKAVFALEPGTWSGPIASGFGLHLVRVSELKRGRLREYDEVKAQVLNAWREQRQREDNEKYFKGLLKKYDVLVDESVKPLVGPLESL